VSHEEARGAIRVTPDLLIEGLHLPEGTRIVGAEWDDMRDCLKLYVDHTDLPERSFLWRPAPRVQVRITRQPDPLNVAFKYTSKYEVTDGPLAQLKW